MRKAQPALLLATPEDTEAQFYEALQTGDLERLMAIWGDEDEVACVHPGGPRVVGLSAIRASFEAIFARGFIPVHPECQRRLVVGDTAIHHVLERVEITSEAGTESAWVVATNVYLKTALGWRLVSHHASPGTTQDVKQEPSIVSSGSPTTLH
ncbi:Ketosteroid isomerase homolog [Roseateles sp. YR242]|uniref:YybH family protein n=1 Tax=Roseateles sp. YR242 TaxID=1855305 RepID=UPI0008BFDE3C|nr:nuclear transport factor 2 family protein [Roseateles sp. YR242]SEK81925.1 Ketosteroid isomerase homolog [Roseateles sp. YR242]